MIDINELRQSLGAIQTEEVAELLDRLEAAEGDIALKESIIDSLGSTLNAVAKEREAAEKEREELHMLIAAIKKQARSEYVLRVKKEEECTQFRARIEAMERQEPFDADSDAFRSAFEASLKAGNWPATRQGDGYRSPSTQIAWRIAFSTVNRMKLYLAPGAKGEGNHERTE